MRSVRKCVGKREVRQKKEEKKMRTDACDLLFLIIFVLVKSVSY